MYAKNSQGSCARISPPYHPERKSASADFFWNDDYVAYIHLMAEWCSRFGVEVWAYCLIPNHVHLVSVPPKKDSLHLAIGEAHRRYTRMINFRQGWRGHLWQGRFASYVMDERYLLACVRYVSLSTPYQGQSEPINSHCISGCCQL